MDQSLLSLFVAATILLSLGYAWGKRRNQRLVRSVFDALVDVLQPQDQRFVNIGGLVGYHATLVLGKDRPIGKVEATLTLLPRQSWLYLPISLLVLRSDRLFLTLHLRQTADGRLQEGHLIERRHDRFAGRIAHAEALQRRALRWGANPFLIYYADRWAETRLRGLLRDVADPGPIRHVALVPDKRRVYVRMVPRPRDVREYLRAVVSWAETAVAGA